MFILWMRRWLLFTVLAPLAGKLAERIGRNMEAKNGPTNMSRRLQESGRFLRDKRRRRRYF